MGGVYSPPVNYLATEETNPFVNDLGTWEGCTVPP